MSTTAQESGTILKSSKDWETWETRFLDIVKGCHLEGWILNGGPLAPEPEQPDLRTYLSDGNALINNLDVVVTPNHLTPAKRAKYNTAFSQWKFLKEEYNRKDAAVAKVREFIRATISPEYGYLYCLREEEPPAWYSTLKGALATSQQTL